MVNRPLVVVALCCAGCTATPSSDEIASSLACGALPRWAFDASAVYTAGGALERPEDGKALPDGRLVVADAASGLRIVEPDGTSRPFEGFAAAGYRHDPPDRPGGANGVFLEDDGRHVLVSDVYTGTLYRADTEGETVTALYDHPYGINAVVRDRRGSIWFTQSATNTAESGPPGIYRAIDRAVPTGGVFVLRGSGDDVAAQPEEVLSGIYFANGIAFDAAQEHLYVSELMMDRVLRFRVDVDSSTVSDRETFVSVLTPDNLAVDADDNLWIASPVGNQIVVVDAACRAVHTVFDAPSPTNAAARDEWVRRSHLGESRLDLFTPDLWAPLPGAVTGMFWSFDNRTVYVAGLGGALLRYDMP